MRQTKTRTPSLDDVTGERGVAFYVGMHMRAALGQARPIPDRRDRPVQALHFFKRGRRTPAGEGSDRLVKGK